MKKPFTCNLYEMYYRNDDHLENNLNFIELAKKIGIDDLLFWTDLIAAPWQLQMQISDSVINFWPHKLKAHLEYSPKSEVANGVYQIACLVCRVLLQNHKDYDYSVLEC